jgi:hypothetical protein
MGYRPDTVPDDVAQVCRNGHLVLGSIRRFPRFQKAFCEDCGAATIDKCQSCGRLLQGLSNTSWMAGSGPYRPPRYCGDCGKPFPWTETGISAADEFADELDLSVAEKSTLKADIRDLTSDTLRTPLAVSRFKKFMARITPEAGKALLQIVVSVATEEAKRQLGMK